MTSKNENAYIGFLSKYQKEEKEIVVLTSDVYPYAEKGEEEVLWSVNRFFIAYIDLHTNELKKNNGRITWLQTEEEYETFHFVEYLKNGCIYRLKVRELIYKNDPDVIMKPCFMLIKVLEDDLQDKDLLEILEEYRKPIIISDKMLGEFILAKDYSNNNLSVFDGEIEWLGKSVLVTLHAQADDKENGTNVMNVLRTLCKQQKQKDSEFRSLAAKHRTHLVNGRRNDKQTEETQKDFVEKIEMALLTVNSDGSFIADYESSDLDPDPRYNVVVKGSIKKGVILATII